MIILSQRDSRWKDIKINGTTSTIGNYGCTITCLAMLADTTPDVIESKLEFSVDKVIWTSINKTDLPIRFPDMGRAYSYNNEKVKEAIDKNGGCLVEVDFDGVVSTPNDRHWVLFIGNGKAYDPWTGTEILTSKYSILKGYCIINKPKSSIISDMTDDQKKALEILESFKTEFNHGNLEGAMSALIGLAKDIPYKDEQILTLTNKVHELELQVIEINKVIEEIKLNYIEKEKEVVKWQKTCATANTNLNEQILKNEELDRLAKDNKNLYLQKNNDFNNLNKIFEEYKKTHPDEIVKFSIISFIKSLFK